MAEVAGVAGVGKGVMENAAAAMQAEEPAAKLTTGPRDMHNHPRSNQGALASTSDSH